MIEKVIRSSFEREFLLCDAPFDSAFLFQVSSDKSYLPLVTTSLSWRPVECYFWECNRTYYINLCTEKRTGNCSKLWIAVDGSHGPTFSGCSSLYTH